MEKDVLVKKYDSQVRANPIATPGLTLTGDKELLRLEGAYNFICQWSFDNDRAASVVAEQVEYFTQHQQPLMWRVYEHDQPDNLSACLQAQGFVANPQGTLMVLPLQGLQVSQNPVDVRQVETVAQLKDYLAIAKTVFSNDDVGSLDYFIQLLDHPDFSLFCAYVDNKPVAASLLQFQPNSEFALLFGGSVLAEYRGKGLYRGMINKRIEYAQQLGVKYLATEARETSRPILTGLGFMPLVKETTWIFSPILHR